MRSKRAFTIIELLVVVAIIAILIGILLPAIGRAQDQARVTQSMSNLRQLVVAHANYGSDHNDNQWTPAPHNLVALGNGSICQGIQSYNASLNYNLDIGAFYMGAGACNPGVQIGNAVGPNGAKANHYWVGAGSGPDMVLPISFETGFGFYGTWNLPSFNQYVNGRFYDPLFYAPKDYWLINAIGTCYDNPSAFCALTTDGKIYRPTYRLSPAALYTPDLFSMESFSESDMWDMPGLLRSPTYSQARYADLKTHKIEHHWLQRRRRDCGTSEPPFQTTYDGNCWPYFFNNALESLPVTSFYDGHIEMLGVREAIDANEQAIAAGGVNASLWHSGTPGIAGGGSQDGYFHTYSYSEPGEADPFGQSPNNPGTSFHVLTRFGILGRDTLSQ